MYEFLFWLSIWIFNGHSCESTVFMDTSVLIWHSTHLLFIILHETPLNKACKSGIRSMSICIHKALSDNNHILSPFLFFNNFILLVKKSYWLLAFSPYAFRITIINITKAEINPKMHRLNIKVFHGPLSIYNGVCFTSSCCPLAVAFCLDSTVLFQTHISLQPCL